MRLTLESDSNLACTSSHFLGRHCGSWNLRTDPGRGFDDAVGIAASGRAALGMGFSVCAVRFRNGSGSNPVALMISPDFALRLCSIN